MKTLINLLLIAFCVVACDKIKMDPSENIANGDFSDETTNWELKTRGKGSGSMEVVDGALKITIDEVTGNDWDVRVAYTKGLIIEKGTRYRLGFDAWTSGEEKNLRLDFNGEAPGEFTHYSDFTPVVLNNYKASLFRSFVMNEGTDNETGLDLFVGSDKQDVFIDNLVLEKKGAPTVDITGDWTIESYNDAGKALPRNFVDFTMRADGDLKEKQAGNFFHGYVSGNEVEAIIHSSGYFKGTVDESGDTIRGTYKSFSDTVNGTFLAVRGELIHDISGTYKLIANYSTLEGTTINNETDYLTINQDEAILSIAGKPGASCIIEGSEVEISGDILPGEGSGGSQTLNGTLQGNSISGTISGNVMQKDAYGDLSLHFINSGDFSMIKQ